MRPAYWRSVKGQVDFNAVPAHVSVIRTRTQKEEAFVEQSAPATIDSSDSPGAAFNRFDITPAGHANAYFFYFPKNLVKDTSVFKAYLDIYFNHGTAGWIRFNLDCGFDFGPKSNF